MQHRLGLLVWLGKQYPTLGQGLYNTSGVSITIISIGFVFTLVEYGIATSNIHFTSPLKIMKTTQVCPAFEPNIFVIWIADDVGRLPSTRQRQRQRPNVRH